MVKSELSINVFGEYGFPLKIIKYKRMERAYKKNYQRVTSNTFEN